jgi:hypothetical protein
MIKCEWRSSHGPDYCGTKRFYFLSRGSYLYARCDVHESMYTGEEKTRFPISQEEYEALLIISQ